LKHSLQGSWVEREAKTQGINLMVNAFTGEYPEINRETDYTEITLNENQIQHAQNQFLEMLESAPGEVRIKNSSEIFIPVITKKYWPYALGVFALGGLLGVMLKK